MQNELSQRVWETRYRYAGQTDAVPERSIAETWQRVATALAGVELSRRAYWKDEFLRALGDFKLLPGGRILAGAGALTSATLANCFVAGHIEDANGSIFDRLAECALTMQWGGGVGCDFSSLPASGPHAAGPVAFMRLWDAMCAAVAASGARRGAMIATLRCDHPDIEQFVEAKRERGALPNFNLSVAVTDDFMAAVAADRKWALRPPSPNGPHGESGADDRAIVRLVPARELWRKIAAAAHATAEPGVLFVDRINRANNLGYCEHLTTTNPCGEVPLPPHGACVLGSLNVAAFVREPFSRQAEIDFGALERTAVTAVRLLDDAVDLSLYPLPEQAEQACATRRIGLGITGLADALIMLGLRYDQVEARESAARIVRRLRDTAYGASIELAAEKGAFPRFVRDAYLAGEYARSLPPAIRDGIAEHGIRNSHLLAIAPAGTISLLANNVSSGVEPVFSLEAERRVRDEHGAEEVFRVADYAFACWRREHRGKVPPAFATAAEIAPEHHLAMVAELQPLVDNSISKTINVTESTPAASFERIFRTAYELGVKGCTIFRPDAERRAVLSVVTPRCCSALGQ